MNATRGRTLCLALSLFAIVKEHVCEESLSCYSLFSVNRTTYNKIFTSLLDFCSRIRNRYASDDFFVIAIPNRYAWRNQKTVKLLFPSHNYRKVLTNFR